MNAPKLPFGKGLQTRSEFSFALALVEFGFKQHENGNNLEAARVNVRKLLEPYLEDGV